jgi:hypothetical protein
VLKVVTAIGTVGAGNTELVGRSYIFPTDAQNGVRLPLAAPTDIDIVAATHYSPQGAPAGYTPDWSLLLDAGCGVSIELYHVKDVIDAVKNQVPAPLSTSSAYQQLGTRVPVTAGTTFGWYVKGLNSIAWDFIVRDQAVTNHFANQARYESGNSNILHVICPFALYPPAMRNAYLALIGPPGGTPVPNASCGSVERDVAGTPAGQWFTSATFSSSWPFSKDGFYGDPLPIALMPDSTVHIGHIGPSDDIRIAKFEATWKNPATITTSWCYQANGGVSVFFRMNTPTQMDVSYAPAGGCPATFPLAGFKSYYR